MSSADKRPGEDVRCQCISPCTRALCYWIIIPLKDYPLTLSCFLSLSLSLGRGRRRPAGMYDRAVWWRLMGLTDCQRRITATGLSLYLSSSSSPTPPHPYWLPAHLCCSLCRGLTRRSDEQPPQIDFRATGMSLQVTGQIDS